MNWVADVVDWLLVLLQVVPEELEVAVDDELWNKKDRFPFNADKTECSMWTRVCLLPN